MTKKEKKTITFFTKFWLSLFDSGYDHVTRSGSWQTVQTTFDALDSDDEQVLGAYENTNDAL